MDPELFAKSVILLRPQSVLVLSWLAKVCFYSLYSPIKSWDTNGGKFFGLPDISSPVVSEGLRRRKMFKSSWKDSG